MIDMFTTIIDAAKLAHLSKQSVVYTFGGKKSTTVLVIPEEEWGDEAIRLGKAAKKETRENG